MKAKPLFCVEHAFLPKDIQSLVSAKKSEFPDQITWIIGLEDVPGAHKVDEYFKTRGGFVGSSWHIWLK